MVMIKEDDWRRRDVRMMREGQAFSKGLEVVLYIQTDGLLLPSLPPGCMLKLANACQCIRLDHVTK